MHDSTILNLKNKIPSLTDEIFLPAKSGTNHKVYISKNYVIRFHDSKSDLLLRESELLKTLNHKLIPKLIWSGEVDNTVAMVEERLAGDTLDTIWKILPQTNKSKIIKDIIQFLLYLKTQTTNTIYSINSGKNYNTFFEFITRDVKQKAKELKKSDQITRILNSIFSIIDNPKNKSLFDNGKNNSLVHGDMIIHNLLTDSSNLIGVIDWELAFYGDSDYDLFRLFYYNECAKAYDKQGSDESYEADFMNQLVIEILNSSLIEDKKNIQKKYSFVRAIFFLNSLYWAKCSETPKQNLSEIVKLWDK